jgi:hypothetical protein
MIRDRACRITDAPSHFKNGKHGKAKVAGSAQDIFDASKVFSPHIFYNLAMRVVLCFFKTIAHNSDASGLDPMCCLCQRIEMHYTSHPASSFPGWHAILTATLHPTISLL